MAKEKQNSEQIFFFIFKNSKNRSPVDEMVMPKQNNQTKQKMLKFFFKNDELFGKFNFFKNKDSSLIIN